MPTMVELGLVILLPPLVRLCIDAKNLKQLHLVLRLLNPELCKLCSETLGTENRKFLVPIPVLKVKKSGNAGTSISTDTETQNYGTEFGIGRECFYTNIF